jgi:hypothetical protein
MRDNDTGRFMRRGVQAVFWNSLGLGPVTHTLTELLENVPIGLGGPEFDVKRIGSKISADHRLASFDPAGLDQTCAIHDSRVCADGLRDKMNSASLDANAL